MVHNGEERLIMESVDIVAPESDDTWRLVGIFGDQKIVKGRIREMHLVDHRILFEDPSAETSR
jgi:predicted RNA-binding protein